MAKYAHSTSLFRCLPLILPLTSPRSFFPSSSGSVCTHLPNFVASPDRSRGLIPTHIYAYIDILLVSFDFDTYFLFGIHSHVYACVIIYELSLEYIDLPPAQHALTVLFFFFSAPNLGSLQRSKTQSRRYINQCLRGIIQYMNIWSGASDSLPVLGLAQFSWLFPLHNDIIYSLTTHGLPARVPHLLKRFLRLGRTDILAGFFAAQGPAERFLLETSVAGTIVQGGVKTNALPERVVLNINSRVEVVI